MGPRPDKQQHSDKNCIPDASPSASPTCAPEHSLYVAGCSKPSPRATWFRRGLAQDGSGGCFFPAPAARQRQQKFQLPCIQQRCLFALSGCADTYVQASRKYNQL